MTASVSRQVPEVGIMPIKAYLKKTDSALFAGADTMDFTRLYISTNVSNSMLDFIKSRERGPALFCMEPENYIPCSQSDVVELGMEFPEGIGMEQIEEKIFE